MNDFVSEYTKVVSNALRITIKYRSDNRATIVFHNTLKNRPIEINPQQVKAGWLSIFGFRQTIEESEVEESDTSHLNDDVDADSGAPVTIFLGYIQFFGYLVHNYSIRHGSHDAYSPQANESLWVNSMYTTTYDDSIVTDENNSNNNKSGGSGEQNDSYETRLEKILLTPLMHHSVDNPLVIGGKMGAVNDLIVVEKQVRKTSNVINSNNRYLLQDLISPFNSIPTPTLTVHDDDPNENGFIPLHELTDNLTPFYATPQSLMFSELHIPPKLSTSFEVTLPGVLGLPPSYNTHMTAPLSDQGWVSIQYRLIVGFNFQHSHDEDPVHRAVYFPYTMRMNIDESMHCGEYLQSYFAEIKFDNDWTPEVNQVTDSTMVTTSSASPPLAELLDISLLQIDNKRQVFLDELDTLIKLDIYEITTQSSLRKKSIAEASSEEMAQWNRRPVPSLKNKFQIRVNNHDLCIISLPRTTFHLGNNIHFSIDLNPSDAATTKVVGVTVHLEAIENYHVTESKDKFQNRYKVTPTFKLNTMACSLLPNPGSNMVRGSINIPQFLTPEFRVTNFLDVRYQLSFKFVLVELEGHNVDDNLGSAVSTTNTDNGTELDPALSGLHYSTSFIQFIHDYQHDSSGTDMRFKFPIVVLP
ncbi:uncharacterized protein KQ657_001458 [Scheffersomyces spartinae]|uniref:Uncharacterized protein n=1 Tax=Scheffersomyces spartinae TaxID=45513 RepID=A0A9P7V7M1_9ASCO|nr:uncharacterized protein KQ657_001458 [Scheffersomyces spartinae]KAG7192677.1 hypothetical protein KQ657_001458 [Scheffersomyces spartinae]